jgi:hypothetical protein
MTEVNRYRDGELSSTKLMQEAMEEAHAVPQGDGAKLEWHKDHESMEQARARMHDEPATVMKWVAAAVIAVDVGKIAKDAAKNAPNLLHSPWQFAKTEASNAAKFAARTAAETYAPEAAGGLAVLAAGAEVIRAFGQGDELAYRSDVDAMDVAVTNLLDLDTSFRRSEWKKYPGIAPDSTMALFEDSYGKPTEFGKQHIPELQAAADAGARAALDALNFGNGPDSYLASRPDIRQRCDEDIAFSKGFENVRYVSTHENAAEKLKALQTRLNERDARSTAAVQVRG